MTKFTYATGEEGEQSRYFMSVTEALQDFAKNNDPSAVGFVAEIHSWSPTSAEHAASFIDADLVLEHICVQDAFRDEGCPQEWADDLDRSPHRNVLTERLQKVVAHWLAESGLIPEFLTLDQSDTFVFQDGAWHMQEDSK